jgi:hypothetical protein
MSVLAAAVCPMTPLLFRHLSGVADPLAELREAAVAAVREATADADEVVVLAPVGGREAPGDWRDPSHSGPAQGVPLSLAEQVGRHLLGVAECTLPATYVEVPGVVAVPQDGRVALLVLGDGAAARRDGAPGYIDERSFAYDDAVAAALAAGDADGLATLDVDLGAELLATGRLTWPVVGAAFRPETAELSWRGDPFGLSYFVALWR